MNEVPTARQAMTASDTIGSKLTDDDWSRV
jgi:hypothetical protein